MGVGPTYSRDQTPADAAGIFARQIDLIMSAEVNDWQAMLTNLQYQPQSERPCPEDNGKKAGQGEQAKAKEDGAAAGRRSAAPLRTA